MSERILHPRLQSIAGTALILGAAIVVTTVGIVNGWFSAEAPTGQRSLTQPLRLVVENDNGYREFVLALRVYHYRTSLQGSAEYRDIFFDTRNWDLFRHGYSYRFRTQSASNGEPRYTIRLEQEPRFVPYGSQKLDLRTKLPTLLGDEIASGKWERVVSIGGGLAAPQGLRAILSDLRIGPQELQPQLIAEFHRSRFDITDKGRSWFELDHELWTFHRFGEAGEPSDKYEDIVIDTRLQSRDPEILRRVKTMSELAKMVNGVRAAIHVPHERAILKLSGG